MNVMHNATIGN